MKILANDGIAPLGIKTLENAGFEVNTTNVAQQQLANYINTKNIEVLLVRSTTNVRKELIDACPNLKLIGRGGVGLDNIDVNYAQSKNIKVINTPKASANAVAELVFAHLFGMVRFLHQSNREMPLEGDANFNMLKKMYHGTELRGKTLGIIGLGNTGAATAKIALGVGMKVIMNDDEINTTSVAVSFFDGQSVNFELNSIEIDKLLAQSDFISVHVPSQRSYVIGKAEFEKMKDGVGIVNTARGGIIDEVALLKAIEAKKVKYAGLDVFEKEPQPEIQLLMNPDLSLTPHIGGSTTEAQNRISLELANQIIKTLK